MSDKPASSSGTDWFSEFVSELETAAVAELPKIEAFGQKLLGKAAQFAPGVIGKMAQTALNIVLKYVGIDIPGENKFGLAVTDYIQQIEEQFGFLPTIADSHAAIQATYTKVVAKANKKA